MVITTTIFTKTDVTKHNTKVAASFIAACKTIFGV